MYIYTYTLTMGTVAGYYCTAKISYSSSPGEGSRRLQLCRAGSQVWAHGSSSGCCSGHDRGLSRAPTASSPPLQESREHLQTSGKLSSKVLGAPWSKQLPSHPSRCSCAGPDSEIASPADKMQISLHHTAILLQQRISVYFLCGCFFHFCSRSKDADLAAVLWCVRTWARPGAETGLGTRKCWARVSPPHCHAPLGPASPQGRGNTQLLLWNSVRKWVCSTVKLWQPWPALQASRLCARLVNQVVLNCQIHQTSKEMKLFPWDSFCTPATEMLHQSFPLKSQAARCSGIPSSSSVGLATSAKQGFIFSAVQTNMSQDDCEKALANIIGMIKRRGKNS